MILHDKKTVEKHLSKLQKLNYNMFRWWRNYNVPKPLPKNKPMYERVNNGDFETSPYFWMAQMALHEKEENDNNTKLEVYDQRKRGSMLLTKYEKLMDDFNKDENERIETFINDSCKSMGFDKDEFTQEFESYPGTVKEFYELKRQQWLQKSAEIQVN